MAGLWYVVMAYGVICLGLVGYLLHLAGRAGSLSREEKLLRGILQTEEAVAEESQDETVVSTGARPGEVRSEA